MRYYLAIWLGKILVYFLSIFRRGGTSLPGLVARTIESEILFKLCRQLRLGTIVITGTNGKTTTSRLVKKVLETGGYSIVCNGEGSNLERGLISSLIKECDWLGNIKYDVGVFEVDEADLRNLMGKIFCRQLVVTNFFRDQLDRFGELNHLRKIIKQAISEMPAGSNLVLNADDPFVGSLGKEADGLNIRYFGLNIDDRAVSGESLDVTGCQICGENLSYEKRYLAHVGKYFCRKCGFKRPDLDWGVNRYRGFGVEGMLLGVQSVKWGDFDLQLNLPGFFNVYNVLAALAVVSELELERDQVIDTINKFNPVFGRFEKVVLDNSNLILMLAKNPTGFNELIKTILENEKKIKLLVVLNDNYADGRDISWIWDVNFEWFNDRVDWVCLSGLRSHELLLRFKYAGADLDMVGIEENYDKILTDFIGLKDRGNIYVLATYTGMLEFRKKITDRGLLADFWVEQ